jgi:hypothetical protein
MLWALKCSEQRLPTSDNAAAALLFNFIVLSYISVPVLIIFILPVLDISPGDLLPFECPDMEELLREDIFPFLPVHMSPIIKPTIKAIIAVHMVDAAKVSPVYNVIEFPVIALFRYGEYASPL